MKVQDFLLWEMRSRDSIDVKRCYIDVAGDLVCGVLLSQIIYWHLPDEHGNTRLRVRRDEYDWLAKKRDDWWDECRITARQFDRALDVLEEKKLVVTKLFRFAGSPTKHIRLNWDALFEALKVLSDAVFTERSKSNLPEGENPIYPKGEMDINETVKTYTERTTEITPKITYKEEEAAAPKLIEVEIEFLEPEESLVRSQDLNDDNSTNEDDTLEGKFSAAAANTKLLKEIERAVYDWRRRPWMETATTFKQVVIEAVYQCNVDWYSIPGGKNPNLKKINDRLRSLNSALSALNAGSITAWEELHNYWITAKALSNPAVQQAFNQVAAANKQASLQSDLQARSQRIGAVIADL